MLTTVLGRSVMAERHGTAPGNVLALHGWARNRNDFAAVMQGLDGLALDLPGFGTTPEPATAWTAHDYAEALVPLLAELDSPVVVGHSFGGRVAVHLAALAPTALRGVVLTGVPLLRPAGAAGGKPAFAYRAVRRLHKAGLVSQQRLEAAKATHGSTDYRNASGVMRDVLVKAVNETYEPELAAMAAAGVPVRLVWGEGDTAAPVAVATAAAVALGAPPPTVVPGSAHLLDASLSAAVRSAVVELLGQGHP